MEFVAQRQTKRESQKQHSVHLGWTSGKHKGEHHLYPSGRTVGKEFSEEALTKYKLELHQVHGATAVTHTGKKLITRRQPRSVYQD